VSASRKEASPSRDEEVRGGELSVRVQLAHTNERVRLSVKGSLFVCAHRLPAGNSELYTPLEQVQFLPAGRRASTGQWVLLLVPNSLLALVGVVWLLDWIEVREAATLYELAILFGILVCSVLFCLWQLKRGRPTARLRLGEHGPVLEFWHKPGRDRLLDLFLDGLRRTQAAVREPATIGTVAHLTPRRAAQVWGFIYITLLLALLGFGIARRVGSYLPLLVALVPAVHAAVRAFLRPRESEELRRTRVHAARGEHQAAADLLAAVLAREPHSFTAWRMLIDLHVNTRQYDEALESCNAVQALGLLDEPAVNGVRQYIATRRELEERRRGAGLGEAAGQPEKSPEGDDDARK
jgi:hypothetical protein